MSKDFTDRQINAVELNGGDVSLVANGANPHTSASLRSEDVTYEQRKAKAEIVGKDMRGGIVLAATPRAFTYSSALDQPSPLDDLRDLKPFREHLRNLRAGRRSSGDALADARRMLAEARDADVQKELAEHRQRIADRERARSHERLEAERRMARWAGY